MYVYKHIYISQETFILSKNFVYKHHIHSIYKVDNFEFPFTMRISFFKTLQLINLSP